MARNRDAGAILLRLDLRGQEQLRRDLEALGPEGERVFRKLKREAKDAGDGMSVAGRAAGELGEGVQDMANRAGPAGRILGSFGPLGLTAAAGIGAVTAAGGLYLNFLREANETLDFIGQLDGTATSAQFAARGVLDFRTQLQLAGGDASQADRSIEEFVKRLGEFRDFGTGELREAAASLGLSDELANDSLPVEAALDRVLEQLAEIEDPSRRLALADKLGLRDAAPLLQRTGDEMERIRETAANINMGFSEAQLDRLAEAATILREIELRRERNQQFRSLAVSEQELQRQQAFLGIDNLITVGVASQLELRDQTIPQLEQQLGVQNQLVAMQESGIAAVEATGTAISFVLNLLNDEENAVARIAAIRSEIARQTAETYSTEWNDFVANGWQDGAAASPDDGDGGGVGPDLAERQAAQARLNAAMDAALSPAERYSALTQQLRADFAALSEEQRTALGLTAEWEARLLANARALAGLTEEVDGVTAAMRAKQGALAALTEAQTEWDRIVSRFGDAETRTEEAIKAVNDALEARLSLIGEVAPEEAGYAEIMERRAEAENLAAQAIKDVNRAEIERAARVADGSADSEYEIELERLKVQMREEGLTVADRVAERERMLNDLVAAKVYTQDEATAALRRYEAQQNRNTLQGRAQREELELYLGVLDGSINSLEDFAAAAVRSFQRVLLEMIRTRTEAEGFSGVFSRLFGGGGGRGGVGSAIASALGGKGGLTFGGGKATGGAVQPGYFYEINERGQEYFAPTVPGVVLPAATGGALPGGGGGGSPRILVSQLIVQGGGDAAQDWMAAIAALDGEVRRVDRSAMARDDMLAKELPGRAANLVMEASDRGGLS